MSAEQNNRVMDAALKAKAAAERKFYARNLKGAWRAAIKAQNLCPSLDGISQMVSTFEVHFASESKIDGETDWYRILSLGVFADEEEVKKQYRKLALQLHPDKNNSVGSESAFQLISDAWSVLSDKSMKMVYDQKMRGHSAAKGANSLCTSDNKVKKRARKNVATAAAAAEVTACTATVGTFWTACDCCRMQYEYSRVYLNHNLLCPNCHNAFIAVETGYPCNETSSSFSWSTKQQQQNYNTVKHSYSSASRSASIPDTGNGVYQQENNYESCNNQRFQWSQYSKTTCATGANAYSTQTSEQLKRKPVDSGIYNYSSGGNGYGQERTTSEHGRLSKRRRNINNINNYYDSLHCNRDNKETVAATSGTSDVGRANGTSGEKFRSAVSGRRANVWREIFQLDTRSFLLEKAKAAVNKKVQDLNILALAQLVGKVKEGNHVDPIPKVDGVLCDKSSKNLKICNSKGSGVEIIVNDESNAEQKRVPLSIDVPDPDFHDFDKHRTERAFDSDQVWATYDSEDGMPRLYAMVQKVISRKPFKIRMSFLHSKSNSELAPISWVASGFTKTCGDFRVGRYQITETVNIFSHRVSWSKGPRGIIKIAPKKGDTWAVYRNWSPGWNEFTPDDVIYKYDVVEVIDDFTDEQGVTVIPLLKVTGFKAVFHRHTDSDVVRRIPKEELFRFSHRVPSCLLTGEEGSDAPKGCHELDPAATPVDLLKVITEVNEDA